MKTTKPLPSNEPMPALNKIEFLLETSENFENFALLASVTFVTFGHRK